jgi:anthranilate phosphoribosyltransferase
MEELNEILTKLLESQQLDRQEAYRLMHGIGNGEVNEARIAAILAAFVMRSISLEELLGFRDALLDLAQTVNLLDGQTVDVCGTGGDKKNTFNISTLTAFVVAGAGIPVAKHGNYGVSSASGSSNVMEFLGYRFSNDAGKLSREIEKTGICFMHAPLFHPALKAVGGVRRQLGVKTFFNILGPLVNPANPMYQLSGVFSVEAGRIFSYLLQREEKQFVVVYSLDGYDEVSLTAPVKIFSPRGEDLLTPADFGFQENSPESLYGGDSVPGAAEVFNKVLKNEGTSQQNNAVTANAALAIQCFRSGISLPDAVGMARESLESGKAFRTLETLLKMQEG